MIRTLESKFNLDAWSDGQTQSKLWLSRELEKLWSSDDSHIWIYGSWYGTLAQILLCRERLSVKKFQLFDIDPHAVEVSKKLSLTWQIHRIAEFKFHLLDCLSISNSYISSKKPDFIINTSCEHFENYSWFKNLPAGQKFAIQSTNMTHATHILKSENLNHFLEQLGPVTKIFFSGEFFFNYPENSFSRFMVIGQK